VLQYLNAVSLDTAVKFAKGCRILQVDDLISVYKCKVVQMAHRALLLVSDSTTGDNTHRSPWCYEYPHLKRVVTHPETIVTKSARADLVDNCFRTCAP
jgi:hypothetical protein